MVSPRAPTKERGRLGASLGQLWGSSGLPEKAEERFQDRGKKAKQINSCLLEMTDWRDIIRQDSKMPG